MATSGSSAGTSDTRQSSGITVTGSSSASDQTCSSHIIDMVIVKSGQSALIPHKKSRPGLLCDLPTDWLIQVLDWLPIRELFVLMRTNKEWNQVCKYLIKNRKSLRLEFNYGSALKFTENPDVDTIVFNLTAEDLDLMFVSLKQMMHLEKYDVVEYGNDISLLLQSDILVQNSATLRVIHVHQMPDDTSVTYPSLTKLSCESFDASNASRMFPRLEELTVGRMFISSGDSQQSLMPNLKVLSIDKQDDDSVDMIICLNAGSLVSVSCWRFKSDRRTIFPKLTDINVCQLPDGNVSFPAIRNITVTSVTRPQQLSVLPLHQIQKFVVTYHIRTRKTETAAVLTLISQMVNLTDLTLNGMEVADGIQFPDLFANMHQLRSVKLYLMKSDAIIDPESNIRKWMKSLFWNNPDISHLELDTFPLSDEDLTVCAQLQNLQSFTSSGTGNSITATGVVQLLRGSSRNVFRKVIIAVNFNGIEKVDKEIRAIAAERGVSSARRQCYLGSGYRTTIFYQLLE